MVASKFDLAAALDRGVLVSGARLFFQRPRIGRARAVADDHQAALPSAFRCNTIWGVVWASPVLSRWSPGFWGARNGVQFALTFVVALKALPVLILGVSGRFPAPSSAASSSAPAKTGGGLPRPDGGGGIEGWFPYVSRLLFLLVRPEGLFGEKDIRRI